MSEVSTVIPRIGGRFGGRVESRQCEVQVSEMSTVIPRIGGRFGGRVESRQSELQLSRWV